MVMKAVTTNFGGLHSWMQWQATESVADKGVDY